MKESISKTSFEAGLVIVHRGLEKDGKSFPALTVIDISKQLRGNQFHVFYLVPL